MNGGEEVSGQFVEALTETAHIFHAAEEAFDQIALTIQPPVIWLSFHLFRVVFPAACGVVLWDERVGSYLFSSAVSLNTTPLGAGSFKFDFAECVLLGCRDVLQFEGRTLK